MTPIRQSEPSRFLKCPVCPNTFRANSQQPNYALSKLLEYANSQESCTRYVEEIDSTKTEKAKRLCSLGVPPALAQAVMEEESQIGLRIFILDNSGSTNVYDRHVYQTRSGQTERVDCSRWEEIKQIALEQAEWAAEAGTPCEFRLLNPGPAPLREGIDFASLNSVSSRGRDQAAQLLELRQMLEKATPAGHTPIAERLGEVRSRIRLDHAELISRGQFVAVVVVTDGCPTSKGSYGATTAADKQHLVQCIKSMTSELPVFMVVRLACNEPQVVTFYNELERQFKANFQVLSDIEVEAKEVLCKGNGWLTYTPIIHRIREGGAPPKLLNLLDKRRLELAEMVLIAQLLLRPTVEDSYSFNGRSLSNGLAIDAEMVLHVLEEYHQTAACVYDPLKQCMTKPVDIEQLDLAVVPATIRAKRAVVRWLDGIKPLWASTCEAEIKEATNLSSASVRDLRFVHANPFVAESHQ